MAMKITDERNTCGLCLTDCPTECFEKDYHGKFKKNSRRYGGGLGCLIEIKRGRYSGWVEGARKLPRDSRESPSYSL